MTPFRFKLLIIICCVGTGIYAMYQTGDFEAEAHVPDEKRGYESPELYHVSTHILEELKKQTALLDQMNCYQSYNSGMPSNFKRSVCGEPLNMTGVWRP